LKAHGRSNIGASGSNDTERAQAYLGHLKDLLTALSLPTVVAAVEILRDARSQGSTVFIAGNGGSATTASHMVTDLMFGRRLPEPGLRVVGLADNQAVITATGNDVSFDQVFARQINRLARVGDVLILVSASGNSPNIIRAADEARMCGVTVIGLTGFDGGQLAGLSDVSIHVPSEAGTYGPVEDIHLIVNHLLVHLLAESQSADGSASGEQGLLTQVTDVPRRGVT
jgi:D-sedoheptulose 7-phosphate isomerase